MILSRANRMIVAVLALASLVSLSGCCATACISHGGEDFASAADCGCGGHGYLAGHLHGGQHQHGDLPPGEHVPLAKFHPLPTRPVFEPQPDFEHYAAADSQATSVQPAEPEPTLAERPRP